MKSIVLGCVVLAWCVGAWAQEADDAERAAQVAYAQGAAAFDAGDYARAATQFRKAYELKPSWKILYNLGQSEAAAGNYGLAIEAFEAYLVQGGDNIPAEREEQVIGEIERLKVRVGSLNLVAPDGLEVLVDGVSRGTTPLPGYLRVPAGVVHTLRFERNGRTVAERKVKVGSTQVVTVSIDIAEDDLSAQQEVAGAPQGEGGDAHPGEETAGRPHPGTAEAPAPQAADSASAAVSVDVHVRSGGNVKAVGWAVLAGGAAALVVGGVAGGVAVSASRTLEDRCDTQTHVCPSSEESTWRKAYNAGSLATVAMTVGAVAAVTGGVLLLVHHRRSSGETPVAWAPAVLGPGAGGIFVQGRF